MRPRAVSRQFFHIFAWQSVCMHAQGVLQGVFTHEYFEYFVVFAQQNTRTPTRHHDLYAAAPFLSGRVVQTKTLRPRSVSCSRSARCVFRYLCKVFLRNQYRMSINNFTGGVFRVFFSIPTGQIGSPDAVCGRRPNASPDSNRAGPVPTSALAGPDLGCNSSLRGPSFFSRRWRTAISSPPDAN